MWWTFFRACVAGVIVAMVSEIADRSAKFGALLLTLPIVSIVAFVFTWTKNHEIGTVGRLARETLFLVPLGLPFFVPLAFADRWGLGFWTSLGLGLALATLTILLYFRFAPA